MIEALILTQSSSSLPHVMQIPRNGTESDSRMLTFTTFSLPSGTSESGMGSSAMLIDSAMCKYASTNLWASVSLVQMAKVAYKSWL